MSHDKASFWVIWLNITVFQRRYYRTRTCTTSVIISVSSGLVDSRIIFQTTYSTNVCQISSNIYIFNKWSRNPAWVLHTDNVPNFILHFRKGCEDHFECRTEDSNPELTGYKPGTLTDWVTAANLNGWLLLELHKVLPIFSRRHWLHIPNSQIKVAIGLSPMELRSWTRWPSLSNTDYI